MWFALWMRHLPRLTPELLESIEDLDRWHAALENQIADAQKALAEAESLVFQLEERLEHSLQRVEKLTAQRWSRAEIETAKRVAWHQQQAQQPVLEVGLKVALDRLDAQAAGTQ